MLDFIKICEERIKNFDEAEYECIEMEHHRNEHYRKQQTFVSNQDIFRVPVKYRSSTWETIAIEADDMEPYRNIWRWSRTGYNEKPFLVIIGNPGTGKTEMACCVLNEKIMINYKCFYLDCQELKDELYKVMARGEDGYTLYKAKTAQFLIIDDFGIPDFTSTGLGYMYQFLDFRYRNLMPTVFTSKDPWQEIERRYDRDGENGEPGHPITERIEEIACFVEITGETRRK